MELQPLQLLRVVLLLELELALQPGLAPESVPVQLQQQVLEWKLELLQAPLSLPVVKNKRENLQHLLKLTDEQLKAWEG